MIDYTCYRNMLISTIHFFGQLYQAHQSQNCSTSFEKILWWMCWCRNLVEVCSNQIATSTLLLWLGRRFYVVVLMLTKHDLEHLFLGHLRSQQIVSGHRWFLQRKLSNAQVNFLFFRKTYATLSVAYYRRLENKTRFRNPRNL